jgi:hypothetical protein
VPPATPSGQQPGGGLLPDAGHARQAVAGVTAQDGQVHVLPGRHPVPATDVCGVDELAPGHPARDVDDADRPVVVDHREQVAVAGDDVHRARLARGERPDDVVGLEPRDAEGRHSQRGEHVEQDRHLGCQRGRDVLGVAGPATRWAL